MNDDDDVPRLFTGRLELCAATAAGFGAWQVVQVSPAAPVGTIELSAPDGDGAVVVRASVADKWLRKGYATEAMGGLIDWAFSHPEVRCIRGEARADDAARTRLYEQSGLTHVGDGAAPGTLRFELRRPD